MPESKQAPLHRLLNQKEITSLLDEFEVLAPGFCLSLFTEDGQHFAGNSLCSPEELNTYLINTHDDQIFEYDDILVQPLFFESQIKGALIAQRNKQDTVSVSKQDVQQVLLCINRTLSLLLTKAIETRDVVEETVERYREINLLYHVGETIGTCLDLEKIPQLVLQEAKRCIKVEMGFVLLMSDDSTYGEEKSDFEIKAKIGKEEHLKAFQLVVKPIVENILETKQPAIVTSPLASESLEPELNLIAVILCVPLQVGESTRGMIVLGRLSEQEIFTASDMKLLLALASQASIALETIRLHLEEIDKQRLEKELAISRQIQLSLLPKAPPTIAGWEFAALYQAARQVGGDLYDFLQLPNRTEELGLVIADVAGKGVPAALFMAFCRTIIRMEAMGGGMPEQVIKRTNQLILQNSRSDDIFLTAFYALLNVQNGELAYANGGHNSPIWFQAVKGECQQLVSKSALLGLFSNISTEEHKVQIAPGDLLVFYTDGITEARNGNGEFFGEKRLISTIMAAKDVNAQVLLQSILDNTNEFIGNSPQSDDFTLFVVKRKKELA